MLPFDTFPFIKVKKPLVTLSLKGFEMSLSGACVVGNLGNSISNFAISITFDYEILLLLVSGEKENEFSELTSKIFHVENLLQ